MAIPNPAISLSLRGALKSRQPHLDRLQSLWLQRLLKPGSKLDLNAPELLHKPSGTRIQVLGTVPNSPSGLALIQKTLKQLNGEPCALAAWYTSKQLQFYHRYLGDAYTRIDNALGDRRLNRTIALELERPLLDLGMTMQELLPMRVLGLPLLGELDVHQQLYSHQSMPVIPIRPEPQQNQAPAFIMLNRLGRAIDVGLSSIVQRQLHRHRLNFDYESRGLFIDTAAIRAANDPRIKLWADRFMVSQLVISPTEALQMRHLFQRWQVYQSYERRITARLSARLLLDALQKQSKVRHVLAVMPYPYVYDFESELGKEL